MASLGPGTDLFVPLGPFKPIKPATQALTAGDNVISFGQQVRYLKVYNASSVAINYEYDSVASAGSYPLAASQGFTEDVYVTVLHVWVPSTVILNGTSAGGLNVTGGV